MLPGEVRGGSSLSLCSVLGGCTSTMPGEQGRGSRKAADLKLLAVSDNIQKARLRVAERDFAP